jgi:hypothetical protein
METWAVQRPFPCWVCGGPTVKMRDTWTRWCPECDVRELRFKKGYVWGSPKDDLDGVPFLDHSRGYYPCP